jgi:hypothetical protein
MLTITGYLSNTSIASRCWGYNRPIMCRNIKPLFNFDPAATNEEVHDAALQFVRKLSGYHEPSHTNEVAFNKGVDEIAHAAQHLLNSLSTDAKPHNREEEAAKARARIAKRFGK